MRMFAGHAKSIGSTPVLGRSPGGENGNPLQYSCLGNPMNRGAWQATVHRGTKNWTWLSDGAHDAHVSVPDFLT